MCSSDLGRASVLVPAGVQYASIKFPMGGHVAADHFLFGAIHQAGFFFGEGRISTTQFPNQAGQSATGDVFPDPWVGGGPGLCDLPAWLVLAQGVCNRYRHNIVNLAAIGFGIVGSYLGQVGYVIPTPPCPWPYVLEGDVCVLSPDPPDPPAPPTSGNYFWARVTDCDGNPIAEHLVHANEYWAETDVTGYVAFELPDGTYRIWANGNPNGVVIITLPDGSGTTAGFGLFDRDTCVTVPPDPPGPAEPPTPPTPDVFPEPAEVSAFTCYKPQHAVLGDAPTHAALGDAPVRVGGIGDDPVWAYNGGA